MSSVRRSAPPSTHATGITSSKGSRRSPRRPRRTRSTRAPIGSATHTAPSASRQMPSGGANGTPRLLGVSSANVRRSVSVPSGRDRERGEPRAAALGHDQRASVLGEDVAVGQLRSSAAHDHAPWARPGWSDPRRWARLVDAHAHVADVGGAVGGDDHVVDRAARDDERSACSTIVPSCSTPQQPLRLHRHDEQAPVGQPPEPRRLVVADAHHGVAVAVERGARRLGGRACH